MRHVMSMERVGGVMGVGRGRSPGARQEGGVRVCSDT